MKTRKGIVLTAGLLAGALLVCPTAQAAAANPSAELNQRAIIAYTDVTDKHWAAADIQYVTERGLFNGTSPTTFAPNSKMSRAMLATVLYRYADSPAVSGSTPYVDVAAGEWYSDAVTWAYQNGIFTEATLGWKQLLPSESVRRAEFAIMLYHYSKTLGKADCNTTAIEQNPFTDMDWNRFSMAGYGPIYNEAVEALLGWAWPNGIVNGNTETTINPLGAITRAEVAVMLGRYDRNVLGGTEPTVTIQPNPEPEPSPSIEPDNKYEGYTLANGKPLSEENVYEILTGLRTTYPTLTPYGAPYVSTSTALGPYGRSATNCSGWALLCSDTAFGNLPWYRVANPSWDEIKVGDLVRFDTETSGHVVVVWKKTFIDITDDKGYQMGDCILVTESGTDNNAHWGGCYSREWLEKQPGYTLYTRYPA